MLQHWGHAQGVLPRKKETKKEQKNEMWWLLAFKLLCHSESIHGCPRRKERRHWSNVCDWDVHDLFPPSTFAPCHGISSHGFTALQLERSKLLTRTPLRHPSPICVNVLGRRAASKLDSTRDPSPMNQIVTMSCRLNACSGKNPGSPGTSIPQS